MERSRKAPVSMPPRELLVVRLFADGQTAAEISLQAHIAQATVYSYIAHARRRYVTAGRPARSKIALRDRLVEDGHLPAKAREARPPRATARRRVPAARGRQRQTGAMSYRPSRWMAIEPGDSVRLRPKRAPGPRLEVTVARLLDRDLADGLGFIDEGGEAFRQYYYDVEIYTPLAP